MAWDGRRWHGGAYNYHQGRYTLGGRESCISTQGSVERGSGEGMFVRSMRKLDVYFRSMCQVCKELRLCGGHLTEAAGEWDMHEKVGIWRIGRQTKRELT